MSTETSQDSENIKTAELIRTQLPNIPFEISATKTYADLKVEPENFLSLVDGLNENDALSFDLLRNIVAIDMGEAGLWAKYHFYSFVHGHGIQVTVPAKSTDLTIPSITKTYPTANWHEREAAEMVGLKFQGHPDPRNLLLEEDLDIHPLRKEHPLQKPEILQGIEDGPPGVEQ
jgi:NADH-quinone oxidoreductase subunit C